MLQKHHQYHLRKRRRTSYDRCRTLSVHGRLSGRRASDRTGETHQKRNQPEREPQESGRPLAGRNRKNGERRMNYIKDLAQLWGVSLKEEFAVHFPQTKRITKRFYLDETKGLMIHIGGAETKANARIMEGILLGTLAIKKMRKK
nr:MAG TPA: hypothetical protein [Caudoviricetes sp.]